MKMTKCTGKRTLGFAIIELRLVVVLVLILARLSNLEGSEAVLVPGYLKYEYFGEIPGKSVQDLIDAPKYQMNKPDRTGYIEGFASWTFWIFSGEASKSHERYGARISGFLVPAESGEYELFLRGDDAAQLFLSRDENAENSTMIAEVTSASWSFKEAGSPETSSPIPFVAGKRCYIHALYKQETGGNFCYVGWRKVGDPTPADSLPEIRGTVLSVLVDPAKGPPLIAEQPKSKTIAAGDTATLKVTALGSSPFTYQWQFRGKQIAGALKPSDAEGKQLIIVSSTAWAVDVGNKFQAIQVPVINCQWELQDDLLMTRGIADTDWGTIRTKAQVEIIGSAHPLAAGLKAGIVKVVNQDWSLGWGLPSDSALKIAQVPGDPTKYPIYAYENGARLADGSKAPARRVHFILPPFAVTPWSADGLKLFDAAVAWAADPTASRGTAGGGQPSRLFIERTAAGLKLTFTGTLQTADAVTGPWADVADAKSPLVVETTAAAKFYRARQ